MLQAVKGPGRDNLDSSLLEIPVQIEVRAGMLLRESRDLGMPPLPVAPQIVLHGLRDRSGVRPLAAYTSQLFEKVLVQHKVRAFHTHNIRLCPWDRRRPRRPSRTFFQTPPENSAVT